MSPTRPRLAVEQLEDRCVPATWGNPWPDAAHLTLSFAPDGTAVGSRTSELFSTLNAIAPTAVWEGEILRAFQTWAVQANINIGIVADDGEAFGSAGRPQGDPRFGDIRLAAYPQAQDELATASPFEPTAGTWAGDIKLNTSYQFSIGGPAASTCTPPCSTRRPMPSASTTAPTPPRPSTSTTSDPARPA